MLVGEEADDTFDGFNAIGAMDGGEDEVAGFSSLEGGIGGVYVADFAQENDIRTLP